MSDDNRFFHPAAMAPSKGLHSPGALVTNPSVMLFVAGQIAVDSDGATVGEGNIKVQTRQAFANIDLVLAEAHLTFRDVVKFATFIVGDDRVAGFVEERAELFPQLFGDGPYPPNTLVVVDRLARPQFLVEIEAIAAKGGDR